MESSPRVQSQRPASPGSRQVEPPFRSPLSPEGAVSRPPGLSGALDDPQLRQALRRSALRTLATLAVQVAIFWSCAGTWRWSRGWLCLGLYFLITVGGLVYLVPRHPEIVVERSRSHEGTRTFDKIVLTFLTLSMMAILAVAALDAVRFQWAPLGWLWVIPAVLLTLLGTLPALGAMRVNRHLEPTVRIQHDRGHRVVDSGPYRFVRHPTYAGFLLCVAATPLLLGSLWAFVPAGLSALVMLVRTALEDRMLRAELPGYAEYARQTRFRILPGVW